MPDEFLSSPFLFLPCLFQLFGEGLIVCLQLIDLRLHSVDGWTKRLRRGVGLDGLGGMDL